MKKGWPEREEPVEIVEGLWVFSPMEPVRMGGVGGIIALWALLASCWRLGGRWDAGSALGATATDCGGGCAGWWNWCCCRIGCSECCCRWYCSG